MTSPLLTHTILVIDDEPTLREVLQMMLEEHGATVMVAGDGAQGVQIFTRHAAAIGTVIADFSMPAMNGLAVYEAIHAVKPGTRFIMTSGVHEVPALRPLLASGQIHFLQKPFREAELLTALSKAAPSQ